MLFSGVSIKNCGGFTHIVDSTKNIATMEGLENIRKYYSTFINSISKIVKSYGGKVLKNIGDCILFYFPKTLVYLYLIIKFSISKNLFLNPSLLRKSVKEESLS